MIQKITFPRKDFPLEKSFAYGKRLFWAWKKVFPPKISEKTFRKQIKSVLRVQKVFFKENVIAIRLTKTLLSKQNVFLRKDFCRNKIKCILQNTFIGNKMSFLRKDFSRNEIKRLLQNTFAEIKCLFKAGRYAAQALAGLVGARACSDSQLAS